MGRQTRSRSHTCGELRKSHVGTSVRLAGWVHRQRDQGGLVFVDLRDRYGMTQLTFNAETLPAAAMEMAGRLRSEFVIAVTGAVVARTPGTENANLATGDIEVAVDEVQLLNESAALPFGLADHDTSASDDIRLEYRYLDLRRPALQSALELRHRVCQSTRRYLDGESFVEIETPLLVRPTPEGRETTSFRVGCGRAISTRSRSRRSSTSSCSWCPGSTATSRSQSAFVTKTCAPTVSPSSRKSIWR